MMGVRVILLVLSLVLTFLLQFTTCEPPLPAHGKFRSSEFIDRSNGYPCHKYPEKRYKLTEGQETGLITGDYVKCNGQDPYKLNVTVFDYQPYARVHILSDTLTAELHRAKPYKSTLYGVVQKCCRDPPPPSAQSRAHVRVEHDEEDETYDLPAPAAGEGDDEDEDHAPETRAR